MKKIQRFVLFYSGVIHAAAIAFCGVAFCAVFGSCAFFSTSKTFDSTYYDSNYIAAIGFDQFAGAETSVSATEVTGKWDFAYRYADDWSSNPVHYLTLSDTGNTAADIGAADGLATSAKVYRLEMVNLITNGDFVSDPSASWVKKDVTTKNTVTDTSVSAKWVSPGINMASERLTLGSAQTNLIYSITAPELVAGQSYLLDFRWSAKDMPNGTANKICVNAVEGSPFSFDPSGHANSRFKALAVNTIQFQYSAGNELLIDDLTIRKVGSQQLRLFLKKTDTTPNLEDFLYIFSYWVHVDPSVDVTKSPYNLNTLKTEMYGVPGSSTLVSDTSDGTYAYSATSTGWVKKSVKVSNGNLQISSDATGAVLQLVIDLDDALPGRVLIAQPELRAYPDGY